MLDTKHKITFFTTCKPFKSEAAIHQENALLSWSKLGVPTLILGQDAGSEEIAAKFNFTYIPHLKTNSQGLPFVSSVFETALSNTTTPFLAYLNSDILCTPSTLEAIEKLIALDNLPPNFLYVTRRINIPLQGHLPCDNTWYHTVKDLGEKYGTWDNSNAIDVFLFNREWLHNIPDFTIGRAGWDNWMLWNATQKGASIIDGSLGSAVFHPLHGYESLQNSVADVFVGEDAHHNRALSQNKTNSIEDTCTHYFDGSKIFAISDDNREQYTSLFPVDISKRYFADMEALPAYTPGESSLFFNRLCTILWRAGYFTPSLFSPSYFHHISWEQLNTVVQHSQNENSEKSVQRLQDIVLESFTTYIHEKRLENRPIYIWGAGLAGKRVYEYLTRHAVAIEGFIDNNPAQAQNNPRLNVISPNLLDFHGSPKPFIIIGSIHALEISKQLQLHGYNSLTDYCG